MKYYVERKELENIAEKDNNNNFVVPLEKIQRLKSANVKEVIYAKWEYTKTGSPFSPGWINCSNCRYLNEHREKFKYCPCCGATIIGRN